MVGTCPQECVGVETTREVSIRFCWGGRWQHRKTILLQICWSIIIIPIVLCQVQNPMVRIPVENSLCGWMKQQVLFSLIYVGNCCRATPWNFVLLASCCTSQSNENHENEESELMCTSESKENHENEESEPMCTGESNENHHNLEYELGLTLRQGASSPDCQKWCCCGKRQPTQKHHEQLLLKEKRAAHHNLNWFQHRCCLIVPRRKPEVTSKHDPEGRKPKRYIT